MRCFALLSAWVFSSKCAAYFQNTCFARTPMERCFCLSVLTKNEVVRHVVPCSTYSVLVLVPFHSCLNYGNRLSSAAIVTRVSKIQKPSVFIGQLSDAVKNHKDSYRSTVLLSLRPPFEAWLQKDTLEVQLFSYQLYRISLHLSSSLLLLQLKLLLFDL